MTKPKPKAEKVIYVKLFGGEQDGYDADIETVNGTFPRIFYVHRNCDDMRIKKAEKSDPALHEILTGSLSILAYVFDRADPKEGVTGGKQYRYNRLESADQKLTDPAC